MKPGGSAHRGGRTRLNRGTYPSGRLFALLFGINILNYADRFTLPAVAPLLVVAFGLSDAELGRLGSAFLLVYALTSAPVGVLADRLPRTKVIGVGVGIWSVATAVTGLCRSFGQLFAVRAFLGVGEASYFPAANSLLADAFPMERRARVMSWWGAALPIGVFLGYAAGGVVGQRFGWQAAFWVVGLPGLLLALLAWGTPNPARGASEGLTQRGAAPSEDVLGLHLLRIPTVAFTIGAETCAYFVLGGLSFWVTVYLTRHYHLDTASAGLVAGALFVVGGVVGTIAGGQIADRLLPVVGSARLLVPAVGFVAGGIGIAGALLAPSALLFFIAYGIAAGFLSFYAGPMSALLQDVVTPAFRARSVALSLLIAHLFGDAFAPSLIGSLSDALGGAAHGGLDRAFWLTPVVAVAAGVVALAGCVHVERDRRSMLADHATTAAGGSGHEPA